MNYHSFYFRITAAEDASWKSLTKWSRNDNCMSNNYVKTICSHMLIKVIGFSLKKIFVFQEVQILIKDHFILNLILKVTGAEDTS